jgi:hypothetical protein
VQENCGTNVLEEPSTDLLRFDVIGVRTHIGKVIELWSLRVVGGAVASAVSSSIRKSENGIRAVFTHGPKGRQISRGGILKKIEIEVWYAGKKGCP